MQYCTFIKEKHLRVFKMSSGDFLLKAFLFLFLCLSHVVEADEAAESAVDQCIESRQDTNNTSSIKTCTPKQVSATDAANNHLSAELGGSGNLTQLKFINKNSKYRVRQSGSGNVISINAGTESATKGAGTASYLPNTLVLDAKQPVLHFK